MAVTTNDLARICHVSRTTVIRALNDTGRISPETKKRILEAAREHGYRPDLLARGLAKAKTYTIGVVVLDVMNQHFAQILNAVEQYALQHDYGINILLHGQDPELEKELVQRLLDYHVDGILLSSVNKSEEYADFLREAKTPIVTIDNRIADDLPFIGINNRDAVREMTAKAIRKGYDTVAFVCPPYADRSLNIYTHEERYAGFLEAFGEAGIAEGPLVSGDGYLAACESLLKQGGRTAFICSGDLFALELMKYFRQKELTAGKDYGLAGFDGVDILDYVVPQIDTVDNCDEAVAEQAMNMLLALIDGRETETEVMLNVKYVNGKTL